MAIRVEELVYYPTEFMYGNIPDRGTKDQVANLMRKKIRSVIRFRPISTGLNYNEEILFELNASRDGSIRDLGDRFSMRKPKYIMGRSGLQAIGLSVMKEFGLNLRRKKDWQNDAGPVRIRGTSYESQNYRDLVFDRIVRVDSAIKRSISVEWRVQKMKFRPRSKLQRPRRAV